MKATCQSTLVAGMRLATNSSRRLCYRPTTSTRSPLLHFCTPVLAAVGVFLHTHPAGDVNLHWALQPLLLDQDSGDGGTTSKDEVCFVDFQLLISAVAASRRIRRSTHRFEAAKFPAPRLTQFFSTTVMSLKRCAQRGTSVGKMWSYHWAAAAALTVGTVGS